jgi:hypothetical protein
MYAVAEQRIDFLYPDGQLVPVHVRLGRPYLHPKGDWACLVQTEGLPERGDPTELFGFGPMHALMIGARFLHLRLSSEVARGAVPHYEGGRDVMSINSLFVFPAAESD